MIADEQQQAIRADAERQKVEVMAAIRAIWNDRDDPRVTSELTVLFSQLHAAERALHEPDVAA